METVIREGLLRLQTTETSCDVILSCNGSRLMAHKLILSIASPVLRDLLLDDSTDPTVLILPDINLPTMSSILDYIYTGSVIVYSHFIEDFLSAANLLKIQINIEKPKLEPTKHLDGYKLESIIQRVRKKEELTEEENMEVYSRKNLKKLPNLVPISSMQTPKMHTTHRKLCGHVIPSPWCPRVQPVLDDPRKDYLENVQTQILHKLGENDPNNNNYQYSTTSARYFPHQKTPKSNPNFGLNLSEHNSNKNHHPPVKPSEKLPQKKNTTPSNPPDPVRKKTLSNSEIKAPKVLSTSAIPDTEEDNLIIDPLTPKSASNDSIIDNINEENERLAVEDKVDVKFNKQKPFKCEECGKCFSQLRNYKYHRSVHEGTKEFAAKCSECGKVFNDRGYLSSHMKIHRDRKEYACPHCPKRFNQRVAYNMHLRIHTGIKPHECTTCGKSFSRKMLLKQHQRVHTGERPYSCPECGKTFADRSNMSLHARLHTGVKPYACNLCPKSFTKKHHLKTHMNFHTGLKPYTCQKCGLAFSQSSNMRTHFKKCVLKESSSRQSISTTSNSSAKKT